MSETLKLICAGCGEPLHPESAYTIRDGKPYAPECLEAIYAAAIGTLLSRIPVSPLRASSPAVSEPGGDVAEALDALLLHHGCDVCDYCRRALAAINAVKEGRRDSTLVCAACGHDRHYYHPTSASSPALIEPTCVRCGRTTHPDLIHTCTPPAVSEHTVYCADCERPVTDQPGTSDCAHMHDAPALSERAQECEKSPTGRHQPDRQHTEFASCFWCGEQFDSADSREGDAALLDLLESRGVESIYFRDGSQLNPGLMSIRSALRASRLRAPAPGAEPTGEGR